MGQEREATPQEIIRALAKQIGVPPALALEIARRESNFDMNAVGTSGERGIFQLMPKTAEELGVDPTDMIQNITGGLNYLKKLTDQYDGDVHTALMAYNGGMGNVAKGTISPQAQAYADDVISRLSKLPVAPPQAEAPASPRQQIADVQSADPIRKFFDFAMNPVSRTAEALGKKAASAIDKRPSVEPVEFKTPDTGAGMLELGKALGSGLYEQVRHGIPELISGAVNYPRETAAGMGAGMVEGLGAVTPLDIATAGAPGALKSARAILSKRAVAQEAAAAAKRAAAAAATPSPTDIVGPTAHLPGGMEHEIGTLIRSRAGNLDPNRALSSPVGRGGVPVAQETIDALREVGPDFVQERVPVSGLPATTAPPRPTLQSIDLSGTTPRQGADNRLSYDVAGARPIADPAGNVTAAEDSGMAAVLLDRRRQQAAARELAHQQQLAELRGVKGELGQQAQDLRQRQALSQILDARTIRAMNENEARAALAARAIAGGEDVPRAVAGQQLPDADANTMLAQLAKGQRAQRMMADVPEPDPSVGRADPNLAPSLSAGAGQRRDIGPLDDPAAFRRTTAGVEVLADGSLRATEPMSNITASVNPELNPAAARALVESRGRVTGPDRPVESLQVPPGTAQGLSVRDTRMGPDPKPRNRTASQRMQETDASVASARKAQEALAARQAAQPGVQTYGPLQPDEMNPQRGANMREAAPMPEREQVLSNIRTAVEAGKIPGITMADLENLDPDRLVALVESKMRQKLAPLPPMKKAPAAAKAAPKAAAPAATAAPGTADVSPAGMQRMTMDDLAERLRSPNTDISDNAANEIARRSAQNVQSAATTPPPPAVTAKPRVTKGKTKSQQKAQAAAAEAPDVKPDFPEDAAAARADVEAGVAPALSTAERRAAAMAKLKAKMKGVKDLVKDESGALDLETLELVGEIVKTYIDDGIKVSKDAWESLRKEYPDIDQAKEYFDRAWLVHGPKEAATSTPAAAPPKPKPMTAPPSRNLDEARRAMDTVKADWLDAKKRNPDSIETKELLAEYTKAVDYYNKKVPTAKVAMGETGGGPIGKPRDTPTPTRTREQYAVETKKGETVLEAKARERKERAAARDRAQADGQAAVSAMRKGTLPTKAVTKVREQQVTEALKNVKGDSLPEIAKALEERVGATPKRVVTGSDVDIAIAEALANDWGRREFDRLKDLLRIGNTPAKSSKPELTGKAWKDWVREQRMRGPSRLEHKIDDSPRIPKTEAEADAAAKQWAEAELAKLRGELPDDIPEAPTKSAAPEAPATPAPRVSTAQEKWLKEIGPPEKGVDMAQWKAINGVAKLAKSQIARGIKDARAVRLMIDWWGEEEAAKKLGWQGNQQGIDAVRKIANLEPQWAGGKTKKWDPNHKRKTGADVFAQELAEQEDRMRSLIDDPRGFIQMETLLAAAGATAGGLYGATDDDSPISSALSGILVGALAGAATPNLVRRMRGKKVTNSELDDIIEKGDTANMLAGAAIIKATAGSVSGTVISIAQRALEGLQGNPLGRKLAKAGLKYMREESHKDWLKAYRRSHDQLRQGASTQTGRVVTKPKTIVGKVVDAVHLEVLRQMIAADEVAMKAHRVMGFSNAEAARQLLVGTPTSAFWQTQVRNYQDNWWRRMLVKFPRVRANIFERTLEYTPVLNETDFLRQRTLKGESKERFIPQEQLSKKALRARGIIGGAAAGAGVYYGYNREPDLGEIGLVSSFAGPATGLFGAGIMAGKAMKKGKFGIVEAAKSVAGLGPSITEESVPSTNLNRFRVGHAAKRLGQTFGVIEEDKRTGTKSNKPQTYAERAAELKEKQRKKREGK